MKILTALSAMCALAFCPFASAQADADQFSGMEGYTVALVTNIVGYVDENGQKKDSFNGCSHGRVIIFSNDKVLTCATYSYTYSYRPTAVIFSNARSFKMLVGDQFYDMRR